MGATKEKTPLMRQVERAKAECGAGVVLLFRLGDYYEAFGEDAGVVSSVWGVPVTKRPGVEYCGVPAHVVDEYVGKLLMAGVKVALCDELEG